ARGAVVPGGGAGPRPGRGAAAVRAGGALAGAAPVAVAALAGPRPARVGGEPLGPGAELWAGGGAAVVLVDGRSRAGAVLAGLRARGVRRGDAVVVRTGAAAARGTAATLRRRWPGAVVLVPPAGRGARPTADGLGAVSPPRRGGVAVGGGPVPCWTGGGPGGCGGATPSSYARAGPRPGARRRGAAGGGRGRRRSSRRRAGAPARRPTASTPSARPGARSSRSAACG